MKRIQELSFGIIPLSKMPSAGEGSVGKEGEPAWHLLLLRHRSGGHWSFPKGHVEAGESPEATAQRELLEETGLNIVRLLSPEVIWDEYEFIRGDSLIEKKVGYFLAEVSGQLCLQDSEISEAVWLTPPQARQRATFPQLAHLIKNLSL